MEILNNSTRIQRLLIKAFGPGVDNHNARKRISRGDAVSISVCGQNGKESLIVQLIGDFITVEHQGMVIQVPHVPFGHIDLSYEASPRSGSLTHSGLAERYLERFDTNFW